MIIEYLQKLRDNPQDYSGIAELQSEGIGLLEIEMLESLYNNGNHFPKVLRELLFLAGDYCTVLDTGSFDSQQEMQDEVKAELIADGLIITRLFYVIDIRSIDDPIFVYLDEGHDPGVYQATPDREPQIEKSWDSLKEFIDSSVQSIINGESPF